MKPDPVGTEHLHRPQHRIGGSSDRAEIVVLGGGNAGYVGAVPILVLEIPAARAAAKRRIEDRLGAVCNRLHIEIQMGAQLPARSRAEIDPGVDDGDVNIHRAARRIEVGVDTVNSGRCYLHALSDGHLDIGFDRGHHRMVAEPVYGSGGQGQGETLESVSIDEADLAPESLSQSFGRLLGGTGVWFEHHDDPLLDRCSLDDRQGTEHETNYRDNDPDLATRHDHSLQIDLAEKLSRQPIALKGQMALLIPA